MFKEDHRTGFGKALTHHCQIFRKTGTAQVARVLSDSYQVLLGYFITTHHSYAFLKSQGVSGVAVLQTNKQTNMPWRHPCQLTTESPAISLS